MEEPTRAAPAPINPWDAARSAVLRLLAGLLVFAFTGVPLMGVLLFVFALGTPGGVAGVLGDETRIALPALFAQAVGFSAGALVAFLVVVGPMEKRSPGEVGFGARGALSGNAGGFATGAALMSAVIGVLALAGWYRVLGPGVGTAGQFAAYVLLFFLIGLYEEVLFRGILFRVLEGWLGTYAAVALSALAFGFVHGANPGASSMATLFIALEAGILLAAVYRLTGNLWWAVGLHWAWNLFQGPVFGVPVSGIELQTPLRAALTGPEAWTGGAFGPENGLVALVLATGLGIYLLWLTARRGLIVPPVWARREAPIATGS